MIEQQTTEEEQVKNGDGVRRGMSYHVELITGDKIVRPTKSELDSYLETIKLDDIRRIYRGQELSFRAKTIIVSD